MALEKLSPSEYGQEEGVVLVNSYVTYWEQKKQAEAELEKLKEALVQYADRYQVDRINGSEYYLTIVRKEIVRFPAKGQAERQKLENILREAGLWPALASLDLNSLEKAILEETLSPEVLEKLKDLISKEKMVTLRASKKAESKDQTKT